MNRSVAVVDQTILWVVVLGCWQLASMRLGGNTIASPAETISRLWELFQTWNFWDNAGETARAVVIAGIVTTAGGTIVGLAIGLSAFACEVTSPILVSVYALPKVILYPLVLLLFGISLPAKVALGVLNGFAPVVIVAMDAVRHVNPTILRASRVLGLSTAQTIARVLLPATLPEVLTGVRIGLALTIVGVLIAEIFASDKGLGFMLATASQLNDNLTVMALTAFVVAAAMAVNRVLAVVSVLAGPRRSQ